MDDDEDSNDSFILHDCKSHSHPTAPLPGAVSASRGHHCDVSGSPGRHYQFHSNAAHCGHFRGPGSTQPISPNGDVACSSRWDVFLLRALRRDPSSVPERSAAGTKKRQPGRVDVSFVPKKGDLIIHHEKKPWRRVLEFYDPVTQRLHDGDILIRVRIDSYSCVGIVLIKGAGYLYHRGYWMYLGQDSDQMSQQCRS